ncbi:MAG: bacteriohemerythrin [bacterium]
MSKIVWRKEYEIGIELIDNQHKSLFELLVKVDVDSNENDRKRIVKEALFSLVDYTKTHFADEEAFMQRINYPKQLEHQAQHRVLIDQIVEILKKIKAGNYNINEKIMEILKNWIFKHIMDHDKQIGEFFQAKQKPSIFIHDT